MKNAELNWQTSTPLSVQYDDPYFSLADGLAETHYVFLKHNGLPERWLKKQKFVIGETGFGSGLNFLVTAKHWVECNEGAHLTYFSVEKHPLSRADLLKSFANWPQFQSISNKLLAHYPDRLPGFHTLEFDEENITLVLMHGDVLPMLKNIQTPVDCWYLDGFSPAKNPDMWSLAVCQHLAFLSHKKTSFSTFTAAGVVRRNLLAVGFDVKKTPGFGKKREMLSGVFSGKSDEVKVEKPWFNLANASSVKIEEVSIIGGGLAGLSCAWMLSREGVKCTVIELGETLATGASGNAAGIVMPRFSLDLNVESQFYLSSFLFAVSCLNVLREKNEDFFWRQRGVLQLASLQRIARIKKLNFPESFLCPLSQTEASVQAGVELTSGGLFFPAAGYVNPYQLCRLLARSAGTSLNVKTQSRVASMVKKADVWQLFDEQGQLISQSKVVIFSNGFDAERLLPFSHLKLSKNRGQITQIPTQDGLREVNFPICQEGYVIPEMQGSHIIGATYREGEGCPDLSQEDHRENLYGVEKMIKTFTPGKMDQLAGRVSYRTTSFDHLPLVGAVPDEAAYSIDYKDSHHGRIHDTYPAAKYLSGLYLTTGHGSRGLVSCFSSANYLTSLICEKPVTLPEEICHALHPGRFLVRLLKKSPNRR